MLKTKLVAAVAGCAVAAGTVAATSGATPDSSRGLPQGSETVTLNPADFTTKIDNPYWPMKPGSRWVYRETNTQGERQKVVVSVTRKQKKIANGVTARVIRDLVTQKGRKVELTYDWYAQDKAGNIWYLGEYVTNYNKKGKVIDHAGSFEAGVDGAQAGVAMPANPVAGLSYRQEYYKGHAEDKAAIVTVGQERVEVPYRYVKNVLMTRDLVPTEPRVQELKFYGRGIGPLLSVHTDGDGGRAELLKFKQG